MLIKATQKNTRQTPRKVRLVANSVKNLPIDQAMRHLAVMDRRSSIVVIKLLRQAVADAMNNHGFKFEELKLKTIVVNPGPSYKRFRAVSRGRAHNVLKRTSHITVELEAGAKTEQPIQPKQEKPRAKETKTTMSTEKKAVAAKTKQAAKKSVTTEARAKK